MVYELLALRSDLPAEVAAIVRQGRTTVRPTMPGSSLAFTHITGAIPAVGSNGVVAGTGRFEGFQAEVRLSEP